MLRTHWASLAIIDLVILQEPLTTAAAAAIASAKKAPSMMSSLAEEENNPNLIRKDRRMSDQGRRVAAMSLSKETKSSRRQTLSGALESSQQEHEETASKTPSKQRFRLGNASSYYFKHLPKTPMEQQVNESMQQHAETSFLSTNSSSTEGSGDLLNHSVLSDTTELTASNFVLATTSRQRITDLLSEKKKSKQQKLLLLASKENSQPPENLLQFSPPTNIMAAALPVKSPPTSTLLAKFADIQSSLADTTVSNSKKSSRSSLLLSQSQPSPKETIGTSTAKHQQQATAARRQSSASLLERFRSPSSMRKSLPMPLGQSSENRRHTASPSRLLSVAATLKHARLEREEQRRLSVASRSVAQESSINGDTTHRSSQQQRNYSPASSISTNMTTLTAGVPPMPNNNAALPVKSPCPLPESISWQQVERSKQRLTPTNLKGAARRLSSNAKINTDSSNHNDNDDEDTTVDLLDMDSILAASDHGGSTPKDESLVAGSSSSRSIAKSPSGRVLLADAQSPARNTRSAAKQRHNETADTHDIQSLLMGAFPPNMSTLNTSQTANTSEIKLVFSPLLSAKKKKALQDESAFAKDSPDENSVQMSALNATVDSKDIEELLVDSPVASASAATVEKDAVSKAVSLDGTQTLLNGASSLFDNNANRAALNESFESSSNRAKFPADGIDQGLETSRSKEAASMNDTADSNDFQSLFGDSPATQSVESEGLDHSGDSEENQSATSVGEMSHANSPVKVDCSTSSPARSRMHSSTKPTILKSPLADSPARNTRTASKRKPLGDTADSDDIQSLLAMSPVRRSSGSASKRQSLNETGDFTLLKSKVLESPERNARSISKRKSLGSTTQSPARSSSKRQSLGDAADSNRLKSPVADSPARNTRSAAKRKSLDNTADSDDIQSLLDESPTRSNSASKRQSLIDTADSYPLKSPEVESPERTTRSDSKRKSLEDTIQSPARSYSKRQSLGDTAASSLLKSPVTDSPARNTRSAAKRKSLGDTAKSEGIQSLLVESPARSGSASKRQSLNDTADSNEIKSLLADSPARNTRGASKRKSLNRTDSPGLCPSKDKSLNKTADSDDLKSLFTGSPAQSANGASNLAESLDNTNEPDLLEPPALNSLVGSTYSPSAEESGMRKRRASSAPQSESSKQPKSILNSSFRGKGSARKPGMTGRRVEFGSPEVAEFNISSPSMNVTPMPAKKLRRVAEFADDTVEIEADMNALLNGIPPHGGLGSQSTIDDAEDPILDFEDNLQQQLEQSATADSSSQPRVDIEAETVEIETDMNSLLQGIPPRSQESEQDIDNLSPKADTVRLDVNMEDLLETAESLNNSHDTDCLLSLPDAKKTSKRPASEDDKTVEIDMDMAALLSGAPEASVVLHEDDRTDDLDSMSVSASTIGSRRRRSSILSRSFNLAPASRLSVSGEGNVMGSSDDDSTDNNVMDIEEDSSEENEAAEEQEVTITARDICQMPASNPEDIGLDLDWLEEFCSSLEGTEPANTFNELLSAVCDQVVTSTAPEQDMDAVVEATEEGNTENLQVLQYCIEKGNTADVVSRMDDLIEKVRRVEGDMWIEWQVSVAENANDHLNGALQDLEEKVGQLVEQENWIESAYSDLSLLLESKGVQRARRKSFVQRQATIDKLEAEVSQMESVLLHSKNEHSVVIERCRSTSSARESMSLRLRLEKEMTDTEPLAMSLARKYTSTKGLHKWKPFSMTDQELFFHFVGPSPEGCASLRFILSGSNGVKCTACVDRNIFGLYKGTSKRFRVVGDFIEARTLALCRETSSQGKLSPHEIGHVLSNFEWQLGRLEHTASELILLRRRYRAILTPSQISSSTNFQLEVDFSNRTGDVKTCAAFELSDSYPFAPLNVRLDTFQGDTDVEGLRRLLLKNAKPGFGYLSRTCDVITAFMR